MNEGRPKFQCVGAVIYVYKDTRERKRERERERESYRTRTHEKVESHTNGTARTRKTLPREQEPISKPSPRERTPQPLLFLRLAVRSTRIRMFPSVTQSPHKERQERAEARRRNPRRGTRKIICTAAAPKGPAFSFLNYLGRSRKYFGTSRKYFWQKPRHIRAESQQTSAESQQNA